MYAIIRAGGKQAKVREGDVLDVERIKGAEEEITYRPLLIVDEDGTVISDRAALDKAKVTATILGENRGEKIEVFKYKNKTGYRRRAGHRQTYSRIQVTKIEAAPKKKKATSKTTKAKTPEIVEENGAADEAHTDEASAARAQEA